VSYSKGMKLDDEFGKVVDSFLEPVYALPTVRHIGLRIKTSEEQKAMEYLNRYIVGITPEYGKVVIFNHDVWHSGSIHSYINCWRRSSYSPRRDYEVYYKDGNDICSRSYSTKGISC